MKKPKNQKAVHPMTPEEEILVHHVPKNYPEPTRVFQIGDQVRIGCLDDAIVKAAFFENKVYGVEYTAAVTDQYGRRTKETARTCGYFAWFSIFPATFTETTLTQEVHVRESSYRTQLSGLIFMCLEFGVNLNPPYQRGLVWTEEEKTKLLDSVFNHVEIGRFVVHKLPFGKQYSFEIVDGKQRLTTLLDFFLDRWAYRGYKFSELSPQDQTTFEKYPIVQIEIEDIPQIELLKYFKKINQTSHPITQEHFAYIDELIKQEQANACKKQPALEQ